MVKIKKGITVAITACMMASIVAGCSKSDDKAKNAISQTGSGDKATGQVSIFLDSTSTDFDANNNAVVREMEKKSNTKINFISAPSGQGQSKLSMLVASNEVPDIVTMSNINILNKYALDGVFIPLDDKIEKSMPNFKKKINKEIIDRIKASDGKLYGVPSIRDGGGRGFWARQDWLDKLGMKPPTDINNYYEMLKAFSEKDPDGNGKKDTFGLSGESSEEFVAPYGIPTNDWMEDGKGGVIRSSTDPKMKEALAFAAKLFKEGIIDPEYSTQTSQRRDEKTNNSQYGFRCTWTSTILNYNQNIQKQVPSGKYTLFPVPTAPGIKKGITETNYYISGTTEKLNNSLACISKNSKNIDAATKFLDWTFTDEYSRLVTFGVEGVHYNMEGGKPKFLPQYSGTANATARYKEAVWSYAFAGYIDQNASGGWSQCWESDVVKIMSDSVKNVYQKVVFFNTPTGENSASEIDKTKDELFTKIIMGSLSVDDGWNQWLKEFDRLGGNKWTQEVNAEYQKRK